MSLSIYAANYYNSSLQSKQNGEKPTVEKQKDEELKQKGLQENVSSTQVAREKYREDGTVSMVQRMQGTEAYLQIKTGQMSSQSSDKLSDESAYTEAARKDTLTISEEGRLASIQMQQQKEGVNTESNSNGTVLATQEEALEETEYQMEDLSEYTDTELKQMYYRGEITLQEYKDETGEIIE